MPDQPAPGDGPEVVAGLERLLDRNLDLVRAELTVRGEHAAFPHVVALADEHGPETQTMLLATALMRLAKQRPEIQPVPPPAPKPEH